MKRFLFDDNSEILFDEQRASIVSLKEEGEELLSFPVPFFAIRFRNKNAKTRTIDSFSFRFITEKDNSFFYEHEDASVTLRFQKSAEDLSVFISVQNKISDVLD